RDPKDAEGRTERVVTVLQDGKTQSQLVGERLRHLDRIDADRDHLSSQRLDLLRPVLQLHELLLARPSTSSFIEVHHDLRAAGLGALHDPDQGGEGQQACSPDQSPIPQTRPIAYRLSRRAERLPALSGRRTMLAQAVSLGERIVSTSTL